MTKSKLDIPLETISTNKPTELKFTDYSINKFQSDLSSDKKTIKTKIENSGLKGLKLSQSRTTKRKYFVQNFWFNNKSDYWTVGEFRPGVYGVNECRNEVNDTMKTHTNSEGMWVNNPKITKKHKNERIKKAEILNRQMKTIRECIEELCKANFPKIRKEGTVTGKIYNFNNF